MCGDINHLSVTTMGGLTPPCQTSAERLWKEEKKKNIPPGNIDTAQNKKTFVFQTKDRTIPCNVPFPTYFLHKKWRFSWLWPLNDGTNYHYHWQYSVVIPIIKAFSIHWWVYRKVCRWGQNCTESNKRSFLLSGCMNNKCIFLRFYTWVLDLLFCLGKTKRNMLYCPLRPTQQLIRRNVNLF